MTAWDDGTLHVKLLDFGIAKVVPQSTLAHTTRSFGTPLYMSPEQIRGDAQIGPAADLYALGQLAFTLLVGHPYWEAESKHSTSIYSLLLKVLRGVSELASQRAKASGVTLPPSFDAWFGRATALEPAQRYQSASELVDAFAQALKARSAPSRTPLVRDQLEERGTSDGHADVAVGKGRAAGRSRRFAAKRCRGRRQYRRAGKRRPARHHSAKGARVARSRVARRHGCRADRARCVVATSAVRRGEEGASGGDEPARGAGSEPDHPSCRRTTGKSRGSRAGKRRGSRNPVGAEDRRNRATASRVEATVDGEQ